jgi:hypothetical protein
VMHSRWKSAGSPARLVYPYHPRMSSLEIARDFISAVQQQEANKAADLCSDEVEVMLPGADQPLRGKEGVRQMIRLAPQFEHSMREEEEKDGEVRITTLTRAPGLFANYTTWRFVMDGDLVRHLSFDLKGAN